MEKYTPYIHELRNRFKVIAITFAAAFIIGFALFEKLISFFIKVFNIQNVQITVTSPYQVFNLALNTGLFLATAIVSPLLIAEFILFMRPALTQKESKLLLRHFLLALFLYITGFLFGLSVSKYVILGISTTFQLAQVSNYWDISMFLSQVLLTAAFLGLIFQFPIVMSILINFNWVEIKSFEEKRPLFIAGAVIFTALLPPTDGISLILMILPIIFLYEITLFILKRKRKAVI